MLGQAVESHLGIQQDIMRRALLLSLVAAACSQRVKSAAPTLDGAGPVRFGMTAADAVKALDQAGISHDGSASDCGYLTARIGGVSLPFMVDDGRVVRVDIRSDSVSAPSGARVGMSEDSLQQLYSRSLVVRPHKYTEGHYLIYVSPQDTLRRLVFETDGRLVTEWRAGLYPQVEYVEGCS